MRRQKWVKWEGIVAPRCETCRGGAVLAIVVCTITFLLVAGLPPHAGSDVHADSHSCGVSGSTSAATLDDGEWPMLAANPQRTSWNSEEVRGVLQPVWYRPIEPYISPKTQVIAAYDRLYISTARGLYVLYTGTGTAGSAGEIAWVYPTELPMGHSPTVYNGVVYVGGLDHKLHTIDALTGQPLWTFEGGAGFETNPLVIGDVVYLGNRDGYMYAIYGHNHPNAGTLKWKYRSGGPILFSAAYDDGVLYFAANDSHAYALDVSDGNLVWKSAKLPGPGFYSWWPVVHEGVVVFASGHNYRAWLDPDKDHDLQSREKEDLYPGWQNLTNEVLLGTRSSSPPYLVNARPILDYHEEKPWRRTYLVLDRQTGEEVTYDFDSDGKAEYAPITWFNTHGASTRYPPLVGTDGRLYQSMHYVQMPDTPISRGHIVGWMLDTPSYTTPSAVSNAVDEPIAYSAGGNLIYWSRHRDCAAGAFDYTIPNHNPHTGFGPTGSRQWNYWSRCLELRDEILPGYTQMYHVLSDYPSVALYRGASDSVNGVYERHGDQNPPIPYKGKLYIHRSNAIIALGDYSGTATALPVATIVEGAEAGITIPDTEALRQILSAEIQKILDAGHLRPGYLSHGLFDQRTEMVVGENLIDYWHHPSDTLYALLRCLPYLPPSQQEQVRTYLRQEYADYPPYSYVHIGWADGAPREAQLLPPEVDADLANHPAHSNYASFYEGWHYPPHMFYALWKYAAEFDNARTVFDNSFDKLEAPPSDDFLQQYPYVHNAYIAGYIGYLELEQLAGYPESADVRAELDRLLVTRVSNFEKDSPWVVCEKPLCNEYNRALNVARNFMFLVPELGEYLRTHALAKVETAIDEYSYVAPYWFVTRTTHMYSEGVVNPLYDSDALFQARSLILQEPREKLYKYLDVPAFEQGDLFYLHKLVAVIEASGSLAFDASPDRAAEGESIVYTVRFVGSSVPLNVWVQLPDGTSEPTDLEVENSSVLPTYDSNQHAVVWSDTTPAGAEVVIRYQARVTTGMPGVLVSTAELSAPERVPKTATTKVIVNPYRHMIPLVFVGN
ncbi:MAG: PQQ-binding-like beta-propeller repeat protein [Anaerolineae bacterium]|nr:PQQ-binding-like beta-propeller repeat protein [Anaerolineae bacterium]